MTKHVMIDIETVGRDADSAIVAIGACAFEPSTGVIGAKFESLISFEDSAKNGFKADCDTLSWWKEQSESVRSQLDGFVPVRDVMFAFSNWLGSLCDKDDLVVWGNGPAFDLVMVATHYKKLGSVVPWHFRNERCVRTQVAVGKAMGIDPKKTMPFVGEAHSALDDAIHQAKYVSVIEMHLNGLVAVVKADKVA